MTNRSNGKRRAWGLIAVALLAGCAIGFAVSTMTERDSERNELMKRGGGFAILNNGELMGIRKDGSLGSSCNLCSVGEDSQECKARADKRGIQLCEVVFRKVDDDSYSNVKDAQSSLEIISSARAGNHVQMCEVVEKESGPALVPKSAHGNGYECWEDDGSLGSVCECAQL